MIKKNKILIIGGGAAGMLAAFSAAVNGAEAVILEKNPYMGKKINITGKGRCNITNDCDIRSFLENVPTNPKFLYKALNTFSPADMIAFCNENGLPTKTERGRRVFPESEKARDVSEFLQKQCRKAGVRFIKGKAEEIITENNVVTGVKYSGNGGIQIFHCNSVILATGGISYPLTGSDGDGFRMAKKLGHTVIPLKPSLIPLTVAEDYCTKLQGLSLKNVSIKITDGEKMLFTDFGELLFTHFGLSGPLILSASAYVRKFPVLCHIDLKPALAPEVMDKRIITDFTKFKNRDFLNALGDLLPSKLIPVIIKLSGIALDKKVNDITRDERQRLGNLLKNLPFTVNGTRPIEEAVVTSGGVNTAELNPSTMESKIVKNLYFAGEIIDLDAYTGGYNLQIAFSTGYLAGKSAAYGE